MKKFSVLVFSLILGLCSFFAFNGDNLMVSYAQDNFIISAFGDSISAGYGLSGYDNQNEESSIITPNSYPEVYARDYLNKYNGRIVRYSVSGDTSKDMLDRLKPYIDKTASDLASFEDTDLITLCIGANNILGPALENISNYLSGSLTDSNFKLLLDEGVKQFKSDYPKILNAFKGKEVVVMTIYNPYRFLDLTDIQVNIGGYLQTTIKMQLTNYQTKFSQMLLTTMKSLEEINNVIRNSANSTVHVVDMYQKFEKLTESQYDQFFNINLSNITINNPNDVNGLMNNIISNCDPHPNKAGHEFIANEHTKSYVYNDSTKADQNNDTQKNDGKAYIIVAIVLGSIAIVTSGTIFLLAAIKKRKMWEV